MCGRTYEDPSNCGAGRWASMAMVPGTDENWERFEFRRILQTPESLLIKGYQRLAFLIEERQGTS